MYGPPLDCKEINANRSDMHAMILQMYAAARSFLCRVIETADHLINRLLDSFARADISLEISGYIVGTFLTESQIVPISPSKQMKEAYADFCMERFV